MIKGEIITFVFYVNPTCIRMLIYRMYLFNYELNVYLKFLLLTDYWILISGVQFKKLIDAFILSWRMLIMPRVE